MSVGAGDGGGLSWLGQGLSWLRLLGSGRVRCGGFSR